MKAGAGDREDGAGPPAGGAGTERAAAGEAGTERAEWGWVWGDRDAQVPLDAPLPALISVALRLLGAFLTLSSRDVSVSPAGLSVLWLLAARDGLKSSEVAERGWWTPGTVTSVVDVLVRDGYVERRRDEADRRVVRLHLTGPGREVVGEAISAMAPKWQQAFDYVDPADEPVIRRFLVHHHQVRHAGARGARQLTTPRLGGRGFRPSRAGVPVSPQTAREVPPRV